jgi:hypothetical protein
VGGLVNNAWLDRRPRSGMKLGQTLSREYKEAGKGAVYILALSIITHAVEGRLSHGCVWTLEVWLVYSIRSQTA